MPTYPLTTLSAKITSAGITAPSYADILASLQASFKIIYGSDIYIAPDSQDGQLLAIFAEAINDNNQAMVAVFQAFSPTFAQGVGLSSVVKINGIKRLIATNSTAVGDVIGQAGAVINNGIVQDVNGNKWNLPATVIVPISGTITVTVTAQQVGQIIAPAGTINKIASPTLGWQSFVSTIDAIPGSPIETDAELRLRQSQSVTLPGQTTVEAISAAVGNVTGVQRHAIYENPTGSTDANGLPAHSFSIVVDGGDVAAVGSAIASRKPPGIQTYGTTSVPITDEAGLTSVINFFELAFTDVYVHVAATALDGYVSTTGDALVAAINAFINGLEIGEDVYLSRVYAPATLSGDAATGVTGQSQAALDVLRDTYNITSLTIGFTALTLGTSDLVVPFNYTAQSLLANITLAII